MNWADKLLELLAQGASAGLHEVGDLTDWSSRTGKNVAGDVMYGIAKPFEGLPGESIIPGAGAREVVQAYENGYNGYDQGRGVWEQFQSQHGNIERGVYDAANPFDPINALFMLTGPGAGARVGIENIGAGGSRMLLGEGNSLLTRAAGAPLAVVGKGTQGILRATEIPGELAFKGIGKVVGAPFRAAGLLDPTAETLYKRKGADVWASLQEAIGNRRGMIDPTLPDSINATPFRPAPEVRSTSIFRDIEARASEAHARLKGRMSGGGGVGIVAGAPNYTVPVIDQQTLDDAASVMGSYLLSDGVFNGRKDFLALRYASQGLEGARQKVLDAIPSLNKEGMDAIWPAIVERAKELNPDLVLPDATYFTRHGYEQGGSAIDRLVQAEAKPLTKPRMQAAKTIIANPEGATVSLKNGRLARRGYAVGGHGGYDAQLPVGGLNDEQITQAIQDFIATLPDSAQYVGTWRDGDTIYLDATDIVDNYDDAVALAQKRNQIAIWDFANGTKVRTGGTGTVPEDIAAAERMASGPSKGLSGSHSDPGVIEKAAAIVAGDISLNRVGGSSASPFAIGGELYDPQALLGKGEGEGIQSFRQLLDDPKAAGPAGLQFAGRSGESARDSARAALKKEYGLDLTDEEFDYIFNKGIDYVYRGYVNAAQSVDVPLGRGASEYLKGKSKNRIESETARKDPSRRKLSVYESGIASGDQPVEGSTASLFRKDPNFFEDPTLAFAATGRAEPSYAANAARGIRNNPSGVLMPNLSALVDMIKSGESLKVGLGSAKEWYDLAAREIANFVGKDNTQDAVLFMDLLAATSPFTGPERNVQEAIEAFILHKLGDDAGMAERLGMTVEQAMEIPTIAQWGIRRSTHSHVVGVEEAIDRSLGKAERVTQGGRKTTSYAGSFRAALQRTGIKERYKDNPELQKRILEAFDRAVAFYTNDRHNQRIMGWGNNPSAVEYMIAQYVGRQASRETGMLPYQAQAAAWYWAKGAQGFTRGNTNDDVAAAIEAAMRESGVIGMEGGQAKVDQVAKDRIDDIVHGVVAAATSAGEDLDGNLIGLVAGAQNNIWMSEGAARLNPLIQIQDRLVDPLREAFGKSRMARETGQSFRDAAVDIAQGKVGPEVNAARNVPVDRPYGKLLSAQSDKTLYDNVIETGPYAGMTYGDALEKFGADVHFARRELEKMGITLDPEITDQRLKELIPNKELRDTVKEYLKSGVDVQSGDPDHIAFDTLMEHVRNDMGIEKKKLGKYAMLRAAWGQQALFSPAYHTRNISSGWMHNILFGGKMGGVGPVEFMKNLKFAFGRDLKDINGITHAPTAWMDTADHWGISAPRSISRSHTVEGNVSGETGTELGKVIGSIIGNRAKIIVDKSIDANRKLGAASEMMLRGALWSDVMDSSMRAALPAVQEEARKAATRDGIVLNDLDFRGSARAVKDLLKKQGMSDGQAEHIARTYANVRNKSLNKAVGEVNRIHFSYDRNKLDELVGKVVPFHYWGSRAARLYFEETLRHPATAMMYARAMEGIENLNNDPGMSARQKGFIRLLGTPLGYSLLMNPMALVAGVKAFGLDNQSFTPEGETELGSVIRKGKEHGIGVFPWVDAIMNYMGAYGQTFEPDPIGIRHRALAGAAVNYMSSEAGGGVQPAPYAGANSRLRSWISGIADATLPGWMANKVEMPSSEDGTTGRANIDDLIASRIVAKNPNITNAEMIDILNDPESPEYQSAWNDVSTAGIVNQLISMTSPVQAKLRQDQRDATRAGLNTIREAAKSAGLQPYEYEPSTGDLEFYAKYREQTGHDYQPGDYDRLQLQRDLATSLPQARPLVVQLAEYYALGSAKAQAVMSKADEIRSGAWVPPGWQGRAYTPDQLDQLADLWVAQEGGEDVQQMHALQKQYLDTHDGLAGYRAWQKQMLQLQAAYGGAAGLARYRQLIAQTNPALAQYLDGRLAQIRRTTTDPNQIADALNSATLSMDAYLLATGVATSVYNPSPNGGIDPAAYGPPQPPVAQQPQMMQTQPVSWTNVLNSFM